MDEAGAIAENVSYIQNLFLKVAYHLPVNSSMQDIITFLDQEPDAYRSLAYESAAYEIASRDLKSELPLTQYIEFYKLKGDLHPFHMQIGLGWAFAKHGLSPDKTPLSLPLHTQQMVYDGFGYYHALFKEKRTIHQQQVPIEITAANQSGYDQGIGRRLWYICKGDVNTLASKVELFVKSRQADLWRGVGIACGYVGGTNKLTLEDLVHASTCHKTQLGAGIALAAYSRVKPDAVIPSISLACTIVCRISMKELVNLISQLVSEYDKNIKLNWISILELKLVELNNLNTQAHEK